MAEAARSPAKNVSGLGELHSGQATAADLLDDAVDLLGLSQGICNALRRKRIVWVHELVKLNDADLLGVPGVGVRGIREIREALSLRGLELTTPPAPKGEPSVTQLASSRLGASMGLEKLISDPETIWLGALGLPARAHNALHRAGIDTLADLFAWTEDDLLKIWNFGTTSLDDVRRCLRGIANQTEQSVELRRPIAACKRCLRGIAKLAEQSARSSDEPCDGKPQVVLEEARPSLGALVARLRLDEGATTPPAPKGEPSVTQLASSRLGASMGLEKLISDPETIWLDALGLPARAHNALHRAGIDTLAELLDRTDEDLLKIRNFGERSLRDVRRCLQRIAKLGKRSIQPDRSVAPCKRCSRGRASLAEPSAVPSHEPPQGERRVGPEELCPCLDGLLVGLGLDARAWMIVAGRSGFGKRKTLHALGQDLSLTRERVRQIQHRAVNRLYNRLAALAPALDVFEQWLSTRTSPIEAGASADVVLGELQAALTAERWQPVTVEQARQVIVAVRALLNAGAYSVHQNWPRVSFLACALPPAIIRHPGVAEKAARWAAERKSRAVKERERSRTWSYRELAEAVLRSAGSPLHWREIAVRAETLGHGRPFSLSAFYNMLTRTPGEFVRVEGGTYALGEWGLTPVASYVDTVAEVLHAVGKPLPYAVILQTVRSKRPVKASSLQMTLDLNPRFYRSVECTYGLRAWLPPREQQTLRTPKRLIEDRESFERVARAEARGYDTERIVERDRTPGRGSGFAGGSADRPAQG